MVIIDTSVWISYLNRPGSAEKRTIETLLDADAAILVGVVLAELLQGCRSQDEIAALRHLLVALPYLETIQSTWIKAGELSYVLRKKGMTLPISDLIIAALAFEHDCAVYSLDSHFTKIPDLQLYSSV
ncbi:MAG TPA: PIN domain-containing protein [Nitrospiraceae bacterium]|nr:PIN domain-containing protein [Nitrospiraceae bacterium]